MAELQDLVERLDRAMVLDGPTFAAFLDAYRRERVRPAALAGGSYASTERALRAQLAGFFADRGGGRSARRRPRADGRDAPGNRLPAHRLRTRRAGVHLVVQGAGRRLGRRHVRHPRGRAPVLPQPLRADEEGFRDAAGPGPDRPRVRRPDRRPGRRRPLRRRAGAPDRALDRVPGRLPPVPAGRAEGLLDRADPGRLVPRPHGSGDRPDPG